MRWITNNWRGKHKLTKPLSERKTSRLEVIWRQWNPDATKEMKELALEEGEERELTREERFRFRLPACSAVFRKMSHEEKVEVLLIAKKAGIQANPPDIQLR